MLPGEPSLERSEPPTFIDALRRRLRAWHAALADPLRGNEEAVPYDWFTDAEVAGYDRVVADDGRAAVDDGTWHDLDAKDLLRRLGAQASIFARQVLYSRLRRGAPEAAGWLDTPADAATALALALARTQAARATLRRQELEVTHVLFHGELAAVPAAFRHLRWVPALHLVTLALLAAGWPVAAVLVELGYLGVYGWAQVRLHAIVARWKRQRVAIEAMVVAALQFGEAGQRIPHPVLRRAAEIGAQSRGLLSDLAVDASELNPLVADYVNLFTLREFATLGRKIDLLEGHLPALREVYEIVAECEARLCLLEFMQQAGTSCRPRWSQARTLRLAAMRHPLLAGGDTLSLDLHGKGAFITGRNGVGKSTLLRALGLNLLFARAFGICFAEDAELPRGPVWSSLRHDDSLASGDSLYMAEMRRAQALLAAADAADENAVFLIDEIFRGTNPLESVAAAAAVLHRLSARALVLVSSHSVVLAPLLEDRLAPLRVVRRAAGLAIEPGVLQEPNGLEMMSRYDIDADIRANAQRVHDWWSGHVSRPDCFPTLS